MGIVLLFRKPDALFPDRQGLTHDQLVSEVRALAAQNNVTVNVPPLVQTAAPVEQTVLIERP